MSVTEQDTLDGNLCAVIAALGLDPSHLVGDSLGSAVAMQYALEVRRLEGLCQTEPVHGR
jgi:pimeloyl-ACP methyl ester carboxylesterase